MQLFNGINAVAHIYMVSDPQQRLEVNKIVKSLEDMGYWVMSKWHRLPNLQEIDARQALSNLHQFALSDVMIVVGPGTSRQVSYEMGLARAYGLRLLTVNVKHFHVYDSLPREDFATTEELLRALDKVSMLRFKLPRMTRRQKEKENKKYHDLEVDDDNDNTDQD